MKKNIAIIGGGGAGVVAAWSLHKIHNITLFEAESTLGGHAYSEVVEVDGKSVPVDMGVEYFSEKTAPNLFALLEHLGVETFVSPLSFSAIFKDTNEYWSNIEFSGHLWLKIKKECDRFHIQMHEVMHFADSTTKRKNLRDFLIENKYSDDFIYKALLPLLTTFSSCKSPLLDYSLTLCSLSFSMGLLSFFHPTYWRKAKSGISAYIHILGKELGQKVFLNSPIQAIKRDTNGVSILLKGGAVKIFDEVIFATHADVSLSLLENPTPAEQKILGSFEYSRINAVLHTDKELIDLGLNKKSYLQYNGVSKNKSLLTTPGSLNRILNHLDSYSYLTTPVIVTYDPKIAIKSSKIIQEKNWKIPNLRPKDMLRKKDISQLQGKNRTWYCGTDTTYTGHEGAILSGFVIANALGATYPFSNNDWARIQFGVVKGLMGIYKPSEKLVEIFGKSIHKTAKLLGLHKSQISRVLLDMYA